MQPEFVTPESLLLDTAERLGRVRTERVAVRVRLSRLGPAFRDPAYGSVAARMFDGLVAQYRCQVFVLSDGDIVVIGKDVPFGDVDAVIYKLRMLFDGDSLVHHDPYGSDNHFCSWYDLEVSRDPHRRPSPTPALSPAEAERIVGLLTDEMVRPFVTAQAAVRVGADKTAHLAFQEIFVSLWNSRRGWRRGAASVAIAGRSSTSAMRWTLGCLRAFAASPCSAVNCRSTPRPRHRHRPSRPSSTAFSGAFRR